MRLLLLALPVVTSQPALAQSAAPSAAAVTAATAMVEAIAPATADKAALDQQIAAVRRGALIAQLIGNNPQVQAEAQRNQAGVQAMLGRAGAIQADALAPVFTRRQAAVRAATIQAYATQFTIPELTAITSFYRSAPGAKLRSTQPQLVQQVAQQVQTQFAPQVQAAQQGIVPRIEAEIKTVFPNLVGAPPAAPAPAAPAPSAPPRR